MFYSFLISAIRVMVTIVLSGIKTSNNREYKYISEIVYKVINNLEFKYKFPLLIYIPILLPFNYLLLGVRVILGDKFYFQLISLFYSLPINNKVYRLLKTLSLFVFYSSNNQE